MPVLLEPELEQAGQIFSPPLNQSSEWLEAFYQRPFRVKSTVCGLNSLHPFVKYQAEGRGSIGT
jgi:hypothetical protein